MDLNLALICGKLAAPPELRVFESGSRLLRVLVSVRSQTPHRRVDVIPVTLWEPPADHEVVAAPVGSRVWVAGTVQRRFWSSAEGRSSRLEIIANHMKLTAADCLAWASSRDDGPVGTGG